MKNKGCPVGGGGGPTVFGREDLTYQSYLKVPELLSLQAPQSHPPHHDELLFIVIHQSYELWFKLILHELETAIQYMQDQEVLRAHHFIRRVVEIFKLLVQQIHILETMTPVDFLEFRDRLNPASGFQSIQFRELEFIAGLKDKSYLQFFKNSPESIMKLKNRLAQPDLRSTYFEMLQHLGFRQSILQSLTQIYQKPNEYLPLYLLTEALVDFDQYLLLWRQHHVRVVERIIGFKRGTGGSSGVDYLSGTTSKKCFPELWTVRTSLQK